MLQPFGTVGSKVYNLDPKRMKMYLSGTICALSTGIQRFFTYQVRSA